jgi:branched-subunit amino acid aminotransferase/4-amino-4-deoxychorismate lyase
MGSPRVALTSPLGTVLDLLLAHCQSTGIPVLREHPNLAQVSQWTGVFVTSTSRLALIVDHVWLHGRKVSIPVSSTAQSLRDAVNQEIEKASTKLL